MRAFLKNVWENQKVMEEKLRKTYPSCVHTALQSFFQIISINKSTDLVFPSSAEVYSSTHLSSNFHI